MRRNKRTRRGRRWLTLPLANITRVGTTGRQPGGCPWLPQRRRRRPGRGRAGRRRLGGQLARGGAVLGRARRGRAHRPPRLATGRPRPARGFRRVLCQRRTFLGVTSKGSNPLCPPPLLWLPSGTARWRILVVDGMGTRATKRKRPPAKLHKPTSLPASGLRCSTGPLTC